MRWAWLLLLCAACKAPSPGTKADASVGKAAASPSSAAASSDANGHAGQSPTSPPPKRTRARIKSARRVQIVEGRPRDSLDGVPVLDEEQIEVGVDGELVLDFNVGARVAIYGPAYLKVRESAQGDELLLREGALTIDMPPGASRPKAAFSVVTPSLRVEVVRSGALALRADPAGNRTTVYVVGGSVLLQMGALLWDEAVSGFPLAAGDLAHGTKDGRLGRVKHEAPTLASALREMRAEADVKVELTKALADVVALNRQELQKAQQRTAWLQDLHRQQVAKGAAARMETQAELARHAAVVARIVARERLLASQREAESLHGGTR